MLLGPRRRSCDGRWRLGGRGGARPRRRRALLRAEQNKAAKARVWGVCGGEMRRRGVAGAFKEGPGILGRRAQERKPAKIPGFRCACERGTRDEEGYETDRWGRVVSE